MNIQLTKKGRYTYIVINGTEVKCASKAAGKRLLNVLNSATQSNVKDETEKPKAPAIIKVSPEMEKMAQYMIRGFHDWSFEDHPEYYLEPGFRKLVGNIGSDTITVAFHKLRDDWEDDCKRAFDIWSEIGFRFKVIDDYSTADIVVDDEKKGAFAQRRFTYAGYNKDEKYVVQASGAREINIFKEWPEYDLLDANIHEIGH